MRFTRLELSNWKNFQSVSIDLQRRAFLVGPNASGKSNLLDALRFLRDLVTIGGGFQRAVALRGGVSRLRCLAARRSPEVKIAVEVGDDEEPRRWRYEIAFSQDNRSRPLVRLEHVVRGGKTLLLRPLPEDEQDEERNLQSYIEQTIVNQGFREVAESFRSVA